MKQHAFYFLENFFQLLLSSLDFIF